MKDNTEPKEQFEGVRAQHSIVAPKHKNQFKAYSELHLINSEGNVVFDFHTKEEFTAWPMEVAKRWNAYHEQQAEITRLKEENQTLKSLGQAAETVAHKHIAKGKFAEDTFQMQRDEIKSLRDKNERLKGEIVHAEDCLREKSSHIDALNIDVLNLQSQLSQTNERIRSQDEQIGILADLLDKAHGLIKTVVLASGKITGGNAVTVIRDEVNKANINASFLTLSFIQKCRDFVINEYTPHGDDTEETLNAKEQAEAALKEGQ